MASYMRSTTCRFAALFRRSIRRTGIVTNTNPLIFLSKKRTFLRQTISNTTQTWRTAGQIVGVTTGTTLAFFGFSLNKEKMTEEEQIRSLVSEGIVKKDRGDIEGASKAFHEALKLSSDFLTEKRVTQNDNLNHRVFIYDQIANMSMEMGQFKDAEALFKETMKLALTLGMEKDDNAMIEMSLKLSMIFLYTGRTEIAHQGLQHCITQQEKKLEAMKDKPEQPEKPLSTEETKKIKEVEANTKILLGKAYKNYANSFLQSRDFKKAEPLIVKSLDISKAELGPQHETTFVIMNDLATCKIMLKEYQIAEDLLKDGIKASKKIKSVMEAALSSNLGALYIRTGRYAEAETICTQGLAIAEKFKDAYFMGPCKACLGKLQELKDIKKKAQEEEDESSE